MRHSPATGALLALLIALLAAYGIVQWTRAQVSQPTVQED